MRFLPPLSRMFWVPTFRRLADPLSLRFPIFHDPGPSPVPNTRLSMSSQFILEVSSWEEFCLQLK